jgi:hypothetical protein
MHDEYRMPLGGGKQTSQPLPDIDCINKKEDDMTILDSDGRPMSEKRKLSDIKVIYPTFDQPPPSKADLRDITLSILAGIPIACGIVFLVFIFIQINGGCNV